MRIQGLNLTFMIKRRRQVSDDAGGGSQQVIDVLRTGIPGRIGATRTPMLLRAQGIEVKDTFDAILRSPDYEDIDIRIDDMIVPETGQFQWQEFAVTAVQTDSTADTPNDFRRHKFLSLRRWGLTRQVQ